MRSHRTLLFCSGTSKGSLSFNEQQKGGFYNTHVTVGCVCSTCTYASPFRQRLGVLVPGNLHADGVADHPVEVGIVGGGHVEELPPEELAVQ